MFQKIIVPFKIEDVYEGFAESQGMLTYDDTNVLLEFQTKDALFGVIKSDIKNVKIPFSQVDRIEFKKGWFSNKLHIFTYSLAAAAKLPGSAENQITLGIAKKNRDLADKYCSYVQRLIAEDRLSQAENL